MGSRKAVQRPARLLILGLAKHKPIELVFCVAEERGDATAACEQAVHCAARPMWKKMGESIAEVFRQVTIEYMCARAEAMGIVREGRETAEPIL